VACSGYPKCRYVKRDAPAPGAALAAVVEGNCPTCQRPLVQRHGRWGLFIGCSGYPDCKYIQPRSSQAAPRDPGEPIDEPCPRCGKPQVLRAGRYGKFKSCTDYPTCKPVRARKAS
jgi:DNA topoisomerase-1